MNLRGKSQPYSSHGAAADVSARRQISNTLRDSASENTRPRILVVEDQDDVRRMVATALELDGYEVDEAGSAAEGLKRLSEQEYALVLSDYAMPGGTGIWMIQEAARRGLMRRTSAMIITAHLEIETLANLAVIYKPIDLDDFLGRVRGLLESDAKLIARTEGSQ